MVLSKFVSSQDTMLEENPSWDNPICDRFMTEWDTICDRRADLSCLDTEHRSEQSLD
jgi:hypothetical protein